MTAWLDIARSHIGEREIPGPEDNPLIVEWGKKSGIEWWNNDDDAWCAVYVNGCLVEAGYRSTKSALARSFVTYGTRLAKPVPGAIVVFPRGSNTLYGHVGFVERVNADGTMTVVNGNVSNMVKRSRFKISTILPDGIRWPPGAPPAAGVRIADIEPQRDRVLGERMLRRDDTGADVEELQVMLDALAMMRNDPETARFGPDTEDAVRAFQRAEGLTIDGIVGPATLSALRDAVDTKDAREAGEEIADRAAKPATTGTAAVGAVVAIGTAAVAEAEGTGLGLWIGLAVGLVALAAFAFVAYRIARQRGWGFAPWAR